MKTRHSIRLLLRLGLFLLCTLILSAAAGARTYTDVAGHWAEDVIVRWSDQGILNGYADGTFRPNAPVTRAQLAEILYRLLGYPASEGYAFEDLPKDSWCYESLTTMNLYRVAVNTGDRIYPNEAITRAEASHMIAQAFKISYHDSADREKAFEDQMKSLKDLKYIQGDANGNLNPTQPITRAEVLTILDRIATHVIREPGVYEIPYKDRVLVTCGGVTLKYVRTPKTPAYDPAGLMGQFFSTAYVMFDAAEQGITLEADESYAVHIYGASRAKPNITNAGKAHGYVENRYAYEALTRTEDFAAGAGFGLFPYIIKTPEQFMNLLKFTDSHYPDRYFLLCNDIVLPDITEPLGYDGRQTVYGNLDGGGHTVTYNMQSRSYNQPVAGLFYIWSGSCRNLTLNGTVDLTLGSKAWGRTIWTSQKASEGVFFAYGGFSAILAPNMTNCTTNMDVTIHAQGKDDATIWAGGLSAQSDKAVLNGCQAAGKIQVDFGNARGEIDLGGLVGVTTTTSVSGTRFVNCSSTGEFSAQNGYHTFVGGLTGLMTMWTIHNEKPFFGYGKIENCWSTATLSALGASFQSDVGGLVGQLYAGDVSACWAKPTITIDDGTPFPNIGALAGKAEAPSTISNCWVNASGLDTGGERHTGGLVGRLLGTVSNCYVVGGGAFAEKNVFAYEDWNDGAVENCLNLTAADAQRRAALLDASGWDFNEIWDRSGAYPILRQCGAAAQRAAQS